MSNRSNETLRGCLKSTSSRLSGGIAPFALSAPVRIGVATSLLATGLIAHRNTRSVLFKHPLSAIAIVVVIVMLVLACSAENTSHSEKPGDFASQPGQEMKQKQLDPAQDQKSAANSESALGDPSESAQTPGIAAIDPEQCEDCIFEQTGAGSNTPFDLQNPNSQVSLDDQGALVVQRANLQFNNFMWVADTHLPGVIKIDLNNLEVVGRYIAGGLSTSRTTVNSLGEAFVGSRGVGDGYVSGLGDSGITKILPYGQNCPDSNNDGVITTSTGVDDVLPWGQDDCVAWYIETPGDIRGMAAQDIPGQSNNEICEGYQPEDLTGEFETKEETPQDIPGQHYLWAGGIHGKIYKVDAKSGEILLMVETVADYGAALSGDGKLYFTPGFFGGNLAFLDTFNCTMDKCDVQIETVFSTYGITVDCKQRVWLSSGPTNRYDPNEPPGQRLIDGPLSGLGGIAADANGWIWACNTNNTIRIDAETLEAVSIPVPCKGVAVDAKGRVFTVASTPNLQMASPDSMIGINMIEPGSTLQDYQLTPNVISLPGFAYAYSDMTGVQTRLASKEPGWYRYVFKGCEDTETEWWNLDWNVEIPQDTWAMFRVRAADSLDDLERVKWHTVACLGPQNSGPGSGFIGAQKGGYLQVDVRFTATGGFNDKRGCVYNQGQSVKVLNFGPTKKCTVPLVVE